MHKTFDTPAPVALYVELGTGHVTVRAEETDRTSVHVDGRDADQVTVEQRDRQIVVLAPPRRVGFLGGAGDLRVTVTLPLDSDLAAKLGSADLVGSGRYADVRLKSGSGDVRVEEAVGAAVVETGSGDIEIGTTHDHLRVKAGSGDVRVGRLAGTTVVSTGSGDVTLTRAEQETAVKSGSGDVEVKEALADLSVNTASGDLEVGAVRRGALSVKGVSGDVSVGVPPHIPVWADIGSLSGSVTSTLDGAGRPEEGQEFLEIRATTVSGDVRLHQL